MRRLNGRKKGKAICVFILRQKTIMTNAGKIEYFAQKSPQKQNMTEFHRKS